MSKSKTPKRGQIIESFLEDGFKRIIFDTLNILTERNRHLTKYRKNKNEHSTASTATWTNIVVCCEKRKKIS